jgi:hypothetical protein
MTTAVLSTVEIKARDDAKLARWPVFWVASMAALRRGASLLPESARVSTRRRIDGVGTTSRHFAHYYADILPLAIVEAPIQFPRMRFYQLWHERTHHSQPQQWLRSLLTTVGRELAEQGSKASKERERSSETKRRGASRGPNRSAKSA